MTQIKHPAFAGPGSSNASSLHDTKPPLKWKRVLNAFVAGRTLNRFEAERDLHDHCLHTTVSVLQGKGVVIDRRDEVVPGFQGIPTHVTRYWIAPESREKASELLGLPTHSPANANTLEAHI